MGESGMSAKAKAARIAAGSGAVLSLGASLVATAGPAGAATFNVTTTADAGAGSLRQAILDANAAPGADTITFQAGLGTIGLTTGHLNIIDDLTITDPEGDVTVDAGGTSRIFYINNTGAVTISGLTLTGGVAGDGGAVNSSDTDLTIANSTITGNASDGHGGGVYAVNGTLTVTDSTFDGNSASGYGGGVRVSRAESLVVTGSTFTGNSSGGDGGGLDADATATVSVTDTTFTGNHADSDGGGLSIYGDTITTTVTVSRVTATGNDADDQAGGMVIQTMDSGTASITDSTFSDNYGNFGGGVTIARFTDEGPISVDVSISGSTFEGNDTDNAGAGLYLADLPGSTVTVGTSTFDAGVAGSYGGGIAADNAGTVTIETSTVSNNSGDFGGGIASIFTDMTVTNTTVSGNTAEEPGGGIAVYSDGNSTLISHSTITGNTAPYGGGVFLGGYGGDAVLEHNILDGNVATGNVQPQPTATEPTVDQLGAAIHVRGPRERVAGEVPQALDSVTLANNLVNGSIAGVVTDGGGNLFELPANLGPLADNGGPTLTHNLLAGSAALDAGDAAFAPPPATDQRGLPRVSNARVDIGAVEVQVQTPVVPPVVPPAQPVPAQPTFTG